MARPSVNGRRPRRGDLRTDTRAAYSVRAMNRSKAKRAGSGLGPALAWCGLSLLLTVAVAGCKGDVLTGGADGGEQSVPGPINLLLPHEIRIHPFTGTRTFDEAGGVRGIEVRVEARDAYADPTKAFGEFRFELYDYKPNRPDHRGDRLAMWRESLLEPEKNLVHWDEITRTYEFKLQWARAIPVGRRFVLVAVFDSPFTRRLFAERTAISGE